MSRLAKLLAVESQVELDPSLEATALLDSYLLQQSLSKLHNDISSIAVALEQWSTQDQQQPMKIKDIDPGLLQIVAASGPSVSLEELGFGMEATVGGVSNFFDRLRDAYLERYKNLWNGLNDTFRTNISASQRYLDKLKDVKEKVKQSTKDEEMVASYVDLFAFYINSNKNFNKHPEKLLKKELARVKWVLNDYISNLKPSLTGAAEAIRMLTDINTKSYEGKFTSTVEKLQHPTQTMLEEYTEDAGYLGNASFTEGAFTSFFTLQKSIAKLEGTDRLGYKVNLAFERELTKPGQMGSRVIPDVSATKSEALDMIDTLIETFEEIKNFSERASEFQRMSNSILATINPPPKFNSDGEVSEKVIKKDLANLNHYANTVEHHYLTVTNIFCTITIMNLSQAVALVTRLSKKA